MTVDQWPQKRCTGANSSKRFADLSAYLEEMRSALTCACECDGRGCTICISADAMHEAADALRSKPDLPAEAGRAPSPATAEAFLRSRADPSKCHEDVRAYTYAEVLELLAAFHAAPSPAAELIAKAKAWLETYPDVPYGDADAERRLEVQHHDEAYAIIKAFLRPSAPQGAREEEA